MSKTVYLFTITSTDGFTPYVCETEQKARSYMKTFTALFKGSGMQITSKQEWDVFGDEDIEWHDSGNEMVRVEFSKDGKITETLRIYACDLWK